MARIFRSTARAPRGSLQEQVEKATNELLSAPDWPTTMEICDVVNMDPRWVPFTIQERNRHCCSHYVTGVASGGQHYWFPGSKTRNAYGCKHNTEHITV